MLIRTQRRTFLRAGGAALVAAPFIDLLNGKPALAAGARAKNLLVFFSPNGTIPKYWRPTGGESDFVLPSGGILESLGAIRNDVAILDELNFPSLDGNHDPGMRQCITNGGPDSIDAVVGRHFANAGYRFPSANLSVGTTAWGRSVQTRILYRDGQQQDGVDDPAFAFNQLFSGVRESSVARTSAVEIDVQSKRRRSVLDLIRGDLGDLQRRLGSEERAKLDVHLESLRNLERSLPPVETTIPDPGQQNPPTQQNPPGQQNPPTQQTPPTQQNPVVAQCRRPTLGGGSAQSNDNFPATLKSQMDVAVAALGCGVTNMATIQASHTVSPLLMSWLGLSEAHHSLSHANAADPAAEARFVKAERWFAEQFVYLVQQLKARPSATGGTLLDDTIVLWAKEMADSRLHDQRGVPMIIAGGGFRGGRYIRTGGANHGRMLVSIINQLGIPGDTFGGGPGQGALGGLA